ncbi:MAG: hypothetical protein JZU64_04205 [Rhodoferax sp.]|nr:hypothetical protein [Rhodoferax sp.]
MHTIHSLWMAFDAMAHLQPIHDELGYHRTVALMNSLLDVVGTDEDHALSGLLERAGDLVSRHEREHDPIASASPKESLLFLLQARGLIQQDLSGIVQQETLGAILSDKCNISAALAAKLGKLFGVSPALFVSSQTNSRKITRFG